MELWRHLCNMIYNIDMKTKAVLGKEEKETVMKPSTTVRVSREAVLATVRVLLSEMYGDNARMVVINDGITVWVKCVVNGCETEKVVLATHTYDLFLRRVCELHADLCSKS